MKTIFLTGANGQLGKEISRMYDNRDDIELIKTDVDNLDISNLEEVMAMVRREKPYAIINCAAYTAVDACEENCDTAYKVNTIGARNLAMAANDVGAKIVHISTDYVFDGTIDRPYTEFDAPNPISVYGCTKFQSEEYIKMFSNKFFIIRTAWLYGDGKNFVKTMLRLAEDKSEVGVVADQFGTPTSTKVVADIIDRLLWTDNYGIFNGTCEGQCSWADFAEAIYELAGKSTTVKRLKTNEYPVKAKRPAYAVLDNYMLKLTMDYVATDWKLALKEYIDEYILKQ